MLTSKCILYTKKKTLPQLPLLLLSLSERSPVLQALLLSLLLDGIRLRGEHIHAVPRLVGLAPLDVDPAPVLPAGLLVDGSRPRDALSRERLGRRRVAPDIPTPRGVQRVNRARWRAGCGP